ncbi:DUF6292 family protein [Actinophytocola sp.]|uniref:DUF6292 family protein n=1 Tax=Actinophytocola sp. TaxID=1872138 RepID=UPI00389A4AF2
MRTKSSHAEALALRDYVEEVATAFGVEASATWHEYGPPSAAYVALADRTPAGRFLMLQWDSETGWCLAVEPEGVEPPVVLATWPERVFPTPAELAGDVRRALPVTLPVRVPGGERPCAR